MKNLNIKDDNTLYMLETLSQFEPSDIEDDQFEIAVNDDQFGQVSIVETARLAVELINRLTQDNWIGVDDELPELKLRVMAFDAGGFGWVSARLNTNGWYLEGNLDTHCVITHWMPLPKSPTKQDI
jgi:hypothetical protein